jgi:hemerythrin
MEVDFEWHDEYLIGVDEVDVQHKRFLNLIKRTYELTGQTSENKEVSNLLDELMKYAHFHFGSEELLMETYLYPKYVEQKSEHVKITKELEAKVEEIKSNKGNLNNLLFYLIKWFVDHDTYFDKEFGDYVNKHRISFKTT